MAELVEKEVKQATLYLDPNLIGLMKADAAKEGRPVGESWNEAATLYLKSKGLLPSAGEVLK